MFKTNKKVKGIIIIIFGSYQIIGHTLLTLIFSYTGPIFYDVPISPTDIWYNYWNEYGLITMIYAAVGLILVILGTRILIKNNKRTMVIRESI